MAWPGPLGEHPSTADTLAWAYYKKGIYQSAIPLLEEAVKQAPNDPNFHYHLAMAYTKLNETAKANTHYQKVLQINPNYPHAAEVRQALGGRG